MRMIALGMAAVAAMAVATPTLAQDRDRDWRGDSWRHEDGWRGRDRGPGVTLRFGAPDRSYARDCRMVRSRVERPNGTVEYRRERRCD
jgi:hypothetical protein